MVKKINGRLLSVYSSPKTEYKRPKGPNFKLSLLGILMGIFLLPNLAYLAAIAPETLVSLTNQEREKAGLNTLAINQELTEAAEAKGKAIIASQVFSHTISDKKFSSWIRDTGYNYSYVGENLAIDFDTSEGVMQAWNDSYAHKKNLLSPYYTEIGLAAVVGTFQGQDTTVVVQIFGAPATASILPLASDGDSAMLSRPLLPPAGLLGASGLRAENLLTDSVIGYGSLEAFGDKVALPNYTPFEANKFIIQPGYLMNGGLAMFFSFMAFIFMTVCLYYYYFYKLNKFISI